MARKTLQETDDGSWKNNEDNVIGIWMENSLCYRAVEITAKWLSIITWKIGS